MGRSDFWSSGDYNAICDRCGFKFKFSELKKEWDGLYVCTANGCWEPRQPQDFVRGVNDHQSVPVSRPENPDVFIGPACDVQTVQAVAGWGTPGCMIAGYSLGYGING